jgi:hypothetical protein
MPVVFNPGTDFEDVCDALEAVTLVRRGASDVAVTSALQRAVNTRELAAGNGKYLAGDTRWHLPFAEVLDQPNVGDRIKDASGEFYHVLDVFAETITRRWKCISRNLRIAMGIDSHVRVQEATIANVRGVANRVWRTTRVVDARVQPNESRNTEEEQAHQQIRTATIYFAEDVELKPASRLIEPNGTQWEVREYTADQSVGQFQAAAAQVAKK